MTPVLIRGGVGTAGICGRPPHSSSRLRAGRRGGRIAPGVFRASGWILQAADRALRIQRGTGWAPGPDWRSYGLQPCATTRAGFFVPLDLSRRRCWRLFVSSHMLRFAALLAGGMLLGCGIPSLAAEVPGTDLPYASYRKQLMLNGWQPVRFCGSPYPEMCTGRSMGSVKWTHPVDGSNIELLLWPCRHGWCLAPAIER